MDENGAESTEELHFFYDAQSRPAFVEYGGAMYRYVHNLQGDIVAIVDTAGNLVVEYKYDTWGKLISITGSLKASLAKLNHFGYRAYAWDRDVEFYYLGDRYYNCNINRFFNADIMIGCGYTGTTLYVYCNNNAPRSFDKTGLRPIDALSVSSETTDQRKKSCSIMRENALHYKKACKSNTTTAKDKTLLAAYSEYRNLTGSELVISMAEMGRVPPGDDIVISAEMNYVYNSVGYVFMDAVSFLGYTGVSDVIAGCISAGAFFLTGAPLDDMTTSQISAMIANVGQVSETTANSLDHGMHRQYTVTIEATTTSTGAVGIMRYRFDEGKYYNGLSISGIYIPNELGTGVRVF